MSSPPQPSLPGDAGPAAAGAAAAAAAAAATASPGPASPRVPLAESSSPSTPGAAGGGQDEENEELPMTMAASVLLTSLPKDAKSALEGAGMEVFRRGKEGEFEKVKIHFRAVGSAPALKQPVRKLSPGLKFEKVVVFLRKQLRLKDHESVFCYVNSVFAPGLDEGIGNLWRCFKVKDELVVAYSITPAFG